MKVHVLFGLLTSSLLFGSASATFTCAGSDNQTVCNALSAFYTATGGASWTMNPQPPGFIFPYSPHSDNWIYQNWGNPTDWGGGTSYCTPWFGLKCDITNSIIITVFLPGNNLVGTIPDIWANMPSLTWLDLSVNQLVGPLPPSFVSLAAPPNYAFRVQSNPGLNGTLSRTLISNCMDSSVLIATTSCFFSNTGLVMPPAINWGASSFDPTTLLASISALTTQITSINSTFASLTATVNSLQVNLTNAQAACSAAG